MKLFRLIARRREPKPVRELIAEAHKVADAQSRVIKHNPEQPPDADLRFIGPGV